MEHKVFFDSIHGHMTFHPLCIDIIDTPEFQRLRNIKQTNLLYYVFPGASHNRFEHCLGTGHLASNLVNSLRKNQAELNITEADVLCVTIAGLCHDIGHGPFSHTWETFIRLVDKNASWKHEQSSIKMIDYMIKSNNLKQKFALYGLGDHDITFIKDLIMGENQHFNETNAPLNMRGPDKEFLFEIVANKRCGIDVDRWDYFLRDSHNLGMKCNYDYERFILFARVINVDGEGLQICMRDKEIDNLYNMFYIRLDLNRRAYKHKVAAALECMLCEALALADPYLVFPGQERDVKMSEATISYDMKAFSKLTDHIFHQILSSCDPKLHDAKLILEKIQRRQLYTCISQAVFPSTFTVIESTTIISELMEIIGNEKATKKCDVEVRSNDLIPRVVIWDYGMSNENPVNKISFYTKHSPDEGKPFKQSDVSTLLPSQFKEGAIRMIVKPNDLPTQEFLKACFQIWCKRHNLNAI